MLDRRLRYDDWRGLGQGVFDNVPTDEPFLLLLEKWEPKHGIKWNTSIGYSSILAQKLSWELLHPLYSMNVDNKLTPKASLQASYSLLKEYQWPCDIHLVNLRTVPVYYPYAGSDQAALLLHRVGYESGLVSHRLFKSSCYSHGYEIPLTSLPNSEAIMTSLSLQHDREKVNFTFTVDAMEVEAFKIKLSIRKDK